MIAQSVARILGAITVGVAFRLIAMVIGWIDRVTGSPIMRERINSGSDRYFRHEVEHWGELEPDDSIDDRP
jgi:hypothetical protein